MQVFIGTECSQSLLSSVSLSRTLNFYKFIYKCPIFRAANEVYSYGAFAAKPKNTVAFEQQNSDW